ncbi:putative relB1 [Vibrio parahaemolyticus VPTS-2010_2]|nr:putative relB1 [Vibrio parahaemolyticus VPTS-2010_2]
MVDVDDYEFMQNRLSILEGIARGERALADGKMVSHEEAKDKMSKWLK